jgi:hypothetical protein
MRFLTASPEERKRLLPELRIDGQAERIEEFQAALVGEPW